MQRYYHNSRSERSEESTKQRISHERIIHILRRYAQNDFKAVFARSLKKMFWKGRNRRSNLLNLTQSFVKKNIEVVIRKSYLYSLSSFFAILIIIGASSSSSIAQTITELEYFFNTDPGVGLANSITSFTNGSEITFTGEIDASGLSKGIHTLFIRAKDSNNNWGLPLKKLVLVDEGSVIEIDGLEYFFDTDPGVGQASFVSVPADTSIELTTQISTTGITSGIHNLFIRARTTTGAWGLPVKKLVLIDKDDPTIISNIVSAEYFFNTDPGFGNATFLELTDASELEETVSISVDSLNTGSHTLYVRVLDEDGEWSMIVNQEITVTEAPVLTNVETDTLFVVENSAPLAISDSITVSASSALLVDSAYIDMRSSFIIGEDLLGINLPDSLSINGGAGWLKVTGQASLKDYQTVLRSITYVNESENPSSLPKTIDYKVYGNADSSNTVTRILKVLSVDDAPERIQEFTDVRLPEDVQDSVVFDLDDYYIDVDSPLTFAIFNESENVSVTLSEQNQVLVSSTLEHWFGFDRLFIIAGEGEAVLKDTVEIEIYSVNDAPPTQPVALAPTNNSEVDLNAYMVWSLAQDTVLNEDPRPLYHVQVDTNVAFGSPFINQSNVGMQTILKVLARSAVQSPVKSKTLNEQDSVFAVRLGSLESADELTDDVKYFWRVRSVDNEDSASTWSAVWAFWLNLENDVPEMVSSGFSLTDSVTTSLLTPVLSWNAASDSDFSDSKEVLSYIVQLSDTLDFEGEEIWKDTTSSGVNSIEVPELEDEAVYFWRVKALDDEGAESEWSVVNAFFVNQKLDPPNPFELLSPLNKIDTLTVNPVFTWERTEDKDLFDYVSYSLRISEDSLFTNIIHESSFPSDTSFVLEGQLPVGTYFWQVSATDTDSLSTWASDSDISPFKFQVIMKVSNELGEELPNEFTLNQNYPNPFNPTSTISFGLPEIAEVRLEVFNLLGQKVATLVNGDQMKAGWHSVQFDAGQLSSGVYIYRIKAGSFVQTKKMLLIK